MGRGEWEDDCQTRKLVEVFGIDMNRVSLAWYVAQVNYINFLFNFFFFFMLDHRREVQRYWHSLCQFTDVCKHICQAKNI